MSTKTVIQKTSNNNLSFHEWLELQPVEFKDFAKNAIEKETLREKMEVKLGNLSYDYQGNKVWVSDDAMIKFQHEVPEEVANIFDRWTDETGGVIETHVEEGHTLISLSSFAESRLSEEDYTLFLSELEKVNNLLTAAQEKGTVHIRIGYVIFNDPELKKYIIENFKIFVNVELAYKEYRATMPSIVKGNVDIYG